MKKWFIGAGILAVVLVAGYIAADILVRKKVAAAIGALPDSLHVSYASLHVNLFTESVIIDSLHGRGMSIDRIGAHGIGFLTYLRSRRLSLSSLQLEGFRGEGISMDGTVTIDSVRGPADSLQLGAMRFGAIQVGAIRARVNRLRYSVPDADEIVLVRHLELDSRKRSLRLDTLRILPAMDQEAIGRKRGHQVDVMEATSEGISMEGLDVMGLLQQRLTAGKISIRTNHIHVFRDRRLPLAPGEKELPMQSLKALPVALRVGSVEIGPTFFAYEEFPAKGGRTGTMKIYRMSGSITPLINHPIAGDPTYITLRT